jgi:hypothetical protein
MEYLSVIKWNEALTQVTAWVNLENIRHMKEITKEQTVHDSTCMEYPGTATLHR